MLLNFSNHNTKHWNEDQKTEALIKYGCIKDLDFPEVSPSATKIEIDALAQKIFKQIQRAFEAAKNDKFMNAVHIQGEFTLVFALVNLLKASGIVCVASTSERNVSNNGNKKIIQFDFVQFREY